MLAATRKNAAEEKSAGTATSVARRRWPPLQARVARREFDRPAERGQHALGVVARRVRLAHDGFASAYRPASSSADFTCALATGSV